MVLTPQLRQRIEMLQMTSLELSELIQQEMTANPVLEEVQSDEETEEITEKLLDQNASGELAYDNAGVPEGHAAPGDEGEFTHTSLADAESESTPTAEVSGEDPDFEEAPDGGTDSFEEIDYGREFQEYLDPGYKTQEFEYKEEAPSFEQFLTRAPSLSEHLEWQLKLTQAPEEVVDAGFAIIGNIDADGRLTAGVEEVAAMCGCSVETVEQARQVVLRLDPVGCGALDVKECLIVQLELAGEKDTLVCQLVRDHLEDLQPHRLQHLAKHTGINIHKLDDEIGKIRALDPYPGRRYSSEEPIYVAPEVYIEKIDGEYVIYFVDDGSPRLRLSSTYQHLLTEKDTTKETRDFIKEKVRSAVDLLRNIEHRRQTIYRVVECIIDRQREFLDNGVEYLKPMMLKDVAEDIGMHLSTISRVVNRKYAHTPQGVLELRRFFSEGMLNEEGEEVSTRILKLRIKRMIEEEDSKKPLTDDEIAKVLSNEGVKLSRRTVAKYRDQMHIPGSRERKTIV